MPDLFGIIGRPLDHSFSPDFFSKKFASEGIAAVYERFPLEKIEAFPELLKSRPELRGLNVTAPYKAAVIPYLNSLSKEAEHLQAVNCIAIHNGKLHGHNTDWQGFAESLPPLSSSDRALIIGNGGAARAVHYAFEQLHVECAHVCRQPGACDYSFENLSAERLQSFSIIVNATPLGTLGKGLPPLPYHALRSGQMLYDLVYNPAVTPFLAEGIARSLRVQNGLEMLRRQALLSWEIWQQP